MAVEIPMSVDNAAPARTDERARQRFISKIRRKILVDLAGDMKRAYAEQALPATARKSNSAPRDGGHPHLQILLQQPL